MGHQVIDRVWDLKGPTINKTFSRRGTSGFFVRRTPPVRKNKLGPYLRLEAIQDGNASMSGALMFFDIHESARE